MNTKKERRGYRQNHRLPESCHTSIVKPEANVDTMAALINSRDVKGLHEATANRCICHRAATGVSEWQMNDPTCGTMTSLFASSLRGQFWEDFSVHNFKWKAIRPRRSSKKKSGRKQGGRGGGKEKGKKTKRARRERNYGSCATERYTLQTEFLGRVAAMQLIAFGSARIKELSVW